MLNPGPDEDRGLRPGKSPWRYAQAVDALTWEREPPELRSPALVCAFRGWNDAAGAATAALHAAAQALDAEPIASVDPEEFFDFQAVRPTIRLSEGQTRSIEWPTNTLLAASAPGAERDLVLLDGTEPNLRWRGFTAAIASAAERLEIELVVTLGALIADVAHTLPVPITGLASDPEMVERLGLTRSNYEGPTGVVGVLHDALRAGGIESASLWAAVPHYVAAVPNPKAALALLRRLEGLTGVAIEATDLEDATTQFERQVDEAVAADSDVAEMVRGLEEQQNARVEEDGGEVPSGDALAREFERFLRQRGGDTN
jgi:proteasome assembly chaperone (PAC2) family protein